MSEQMHVERLRRMLDGEAVPAQLTDAVIGRVGEVAPLLPCKQVQAVCVTVDPTPRLLPLWCSKEKKRWALYFFFQVVEPSQYEGVELMMYVRWNPLWAKKGIDYRSKLYKCACVAVGRRLDRKEVIETSLFQRKVFLCDLAVVRKGPAAYSIIETLVEKRTS